MKKHPPLRKILKYALAILGIGFFLFYLSTIDAHSIELVTKRLGLWGPLFFVLVLASTHIIAPLSGTALYLLSIRLYGYEMALVLYYFACMTSALVSFYLTRKWGRPLVLKLIGKKSLQKIDMVVHNHETILLWTGRIFGYFFFDFVSYLLGFTKISFKKYITYTATLTLIPITLLYFGFKNMDFASFRGMSIYYIFIFVIGFIFSLTFFLIVKKESTVEEKNTLHS